MSHCCAGTSNAYKKKLYQIISDIFLLVYEQFMEKLRIKLTFWLRKTIFADIGNVFFCIPVPVVCYIMVDKYFVMWNNNNKEKSFTRNYLNNGGDLYLHIIFGSTAHEAHA